jgi:hypothetical protein
MTWQGKADYWAAKTAMPRLFGPKARDITIRGARQIFALDEALATHFEDYEPDLSAACRYR